MVAVAGAGLLPAQGTASDWIAIGTDGDGRNWSVDAGSIRVVGDLVHAWKRVEMPEASVYPPTGQPVAVAEFLSYNDCGRATEGVKESRLFSPEGALIASHVDPDERIQWQAVVPGTFLASMSRFVCERTR